MRAASAIAVCLSISSQALGQVELPELPYEQAALEPYISNETVSFHYGKHHQGYVNNLNGFIEDDPSLEGLDLSEIMLQTEGTIFNNAAQIYNHNLYWNSLSPTGGGTPTGDLNTSIADAFGGYEEFRTAFTGLASGHFGSGWAWLMMHEDGSVDVIDSHDASNPVAEGLGFPLLVCDVWEHAYYLDYQNLRSDYIEGWWALVNWEYAETEYARVLEEGTSFSNDDIDGAAEGEDTEAESLSAAASSMFGKGGCFLSAVSFAAAGLFAMLLGL